MRNEMTLSLFSNERPCPQCNLIKTREQFSWGGKRKREAKRCRDCRARNPGGDPRANVRREQKRYRGNRQAILEQHRERRQRNLNRELHRAAKQRAKNLGLPFDIEVSDVIVPKVCPVFGLELRINAGKNGPNSPTLDRIVPALGYVRGNVIVISHRANLLKSDATPAELKTVADFFAKLLEAKQ